VSVSKVGGKSGTLGRRPNASTNSSPRDAIMDLTPDQEAEAQRLFQALKRTADEDLLALARLLAAQPDSQLFGRTEFEVRDRVHALGAKALQAALDGRKKGGTGGRAPAAPAVPATPGSSATPPAAS
jgi:hypothetical protein